MKLTCPACYAQYTLDAALGANASRSALATALAMPAPLATALGVYLGMFRAPNRAVAPDRLERLLAELLPQLQAEEVTRNGNTRRAPLALWQDGLKQMVEQRDAGKLHLPLKSHGYLLEIVYAAADRVEAVAERTTEAERRTGQNREQAERKHELDRRIGVIRNDVALGLIEPAEGERRIAIARKELQP